MFGFWFEVIFDNLGEEHLSNSDHAAPSSIGDKGLCMSILLEKFRKTRLIGDPEDVLEVLGDLFVDFMIIGRVTHILFAQKVYGLVRRKSLL